MRPACCRLPQCPAHATWTAQVIQKRSTSKVCLTAKKPICVQYKRVGYNLDSVVTAWDVGRHTLEVIVTKAHVQPVCCSQSFLKHWDCQWMCSWQGLAHQCILRHISASSVFMSVFLLSNFKQEAVMQLANSVVQNSRTAFAVSSSIVASNWQTYAQRNYLTAWTRQKGMDMHTQKQQQQPGCTAPLVTHCLACTQHWKA